MKNIFAVFVLILLTSAMCAKKEPVQQEKKTEARLPQKVEAQTQPVDVTLWHSYRADENKALEEIANKFNEANKGKISVKLLQIPYDAFIDKVTITVPRGHGPDLFIFAHNMIGEWVDDVKILEPVGEYINRDMLKSFIPETVKALVYHETLYGLPLAFKNICLFYNRKLVKTPPANIEEMIKTAAAISDEKNGIYGLVYEASLLYFHALWLHGFRGAVFSEDGKPEIDSNESISALEFARDLVKKFKIVPKGMTSFMVSSLFNEGKAGMVLNGQWFMGEIAPDADFGVALLPEIKSGVRAKPFLGSEAIFLSNKSLHKKEAAEFMIFLASDQSALVRATVGKQTAANIKIYEDPLIKDNQVFRIFKEQASMSVIMPSRPEMQTVWSTYDMALNKTIFGNYNVQKALKEAQDKVVKDIQSRGR
jgi:arabinogalactan oligomer/maltooligosaccharide transport system substrate-binding protein